MLHRHTINTNICKIIGIYFIYIFTLHIQYVLVAVVEAYYIESIWVVNFSLSRDSSSHLISVTSSLATASLHGIHVYNVSFGAHYAHRIESTKSWVSTNVSMATHHWMGRGEVHSVLRLEWLFRSGWLSHRSVRNGDWGHLWNPPPPASTNTVKPTGRESICMLL